MIVKAGAEKLEVSAECVRVGRYNVEFIVHHSSLQMEIGSSIFTTDAEDVVTLSPLITARERPQSTKKTKFSDTVELCDSNSPAERAGFI